MQAPANELPRKTLPRTSVNKGIKKGRRADALLYGASPNAFLIESITA
jgi:hypothetical protein